MTYGNYYRSTFNRNSHTKNIKDYVHEVVYDMEDRLKQQHEIDRRLSPCFDLLYCQHPTRVALITGDTAITRTLFTTILRSLALIQKKATTVVVPEGAGFDLAAYLSCNHLCLDITSNGQWMDGKCYDAIAKGLKVIVDAKLEIVDAPSFDVSLEQAATRANLEFLCFTGFPDHDPVSELTSLRELAVGKNIPVLALNTGSPVDHRDLREHIDVYYHIEVVDRLQCRLTVESYHLKEKEEVIVMLNPSKLWIDSIEAVVG
jgi:hypothetical protein